MENLEEQNNHFNYLYKRLDDKYSTLANIYGISDCAMWISDFQSLKEKEIETFINSQKVCRFFACKFR